MRTPNSCVPLLAALTFLGSVGSFSALEAAPVLEEVTTCGQVVTGSGFLSADLDCSAFADDAITVNDGELDLRGFTVTGGEGVGVRCLNTCTVYSVPPGGMIVDAGEDGVAVGDGLLDISARATISDVVIRGNGSIEHYMPGKRGPDAGVRLMRSDTSVKLFNVVVENNVGAGVSGRKRIKVLDSIIRDNQFEGIDGERVTVKNSTVSGNAIRGIDSERVKVIDSSVTNNASTGVWGVKSVKLVRSVSFFNGTGVGGRFASVGVKESEVSNNLGIGISGHGGSISVKDSLVVGNAGTGVDGSGTKVKVKNSTIDGNSAGVSVDGAKVKILRSDVTGNQGVGVRATDRPRSPSLIRVKESMILGNATDISAEREPRFEFITGINECETSSMVGVVPDLSWGICFFDCGNGSVTAGEECDDGGESAACDDDCTISLCGDSNANAAAGEQCDDGNLVSDDGCDSNCIIEFCGDGITQPGIGEACDDIGESATCDTDCTSVVCGDGIRNKTAGEQCDDGNTNNGDGCSSTCTKE